MDIIQRLTSDWVVFDIALVLSVLYAIPSVHLVYSVESIEQGMRYSEPPSKREHGRDGTLARPHTVL